MKNALRWIALLLILALLPGAAGAETVRVGWWDQPGYMERDDAGAPYGYLHEYLLAIAQHTGWTYEFSQVPFAEAYQKLRAGELDVIGCLLYSEERAGELLYAAQPAGEEELALYVLEDGGVSADGLDGAGVGVMTDSTANEKALRQYAAQHGFTPRVVYKDTADELNAALRSGEVAAVAGGGYSHYPDTRMLVKFGEQPFYFAGTRSERGQRLIGELNDAMDTLRHNDRLLHQRLREGYLTDNVDVFAVTGAERASVAQLGALTAACDESHNPLVSLDPVTGKLSGVAYHVLNDTAGQLGLTIEYVPKNADASPAIIAAASDAELMTGAGYRMSASYLTLPVTLLYAGNEPSLDDVAVVSGFHMAKPLRGVGRKTLFESPEDCMDAVLSGQCGAALVNSYAARTLLSQARYASLHSQTQTGAFVHACFAVREDIADTLLPLLNRAISHITNTQMNEYLIATTLDDQEINLGAIALRLPSDVVLVTVSLVLLITLLATLLVLRERRQRADKARASELSLFLSYVCKVNDSVSEVDMSAGTRTRYAVENGQITRSRELMTGTPYSEERVYPGDWELVLARTSAAELLRLVDEQAEASLEFRMREDKDAPYRWHRVILQGMARDKSHPNNYMIYLMDIDDTRRADEEKKRQLRAALQMAEQASAAKSRFTARISHEIRSPLNAVLGYLTIAKGSTDNPEKLMECFGKSELAAQHLLDLINDVLDMSSIENGKMQINRAPFDLRALLDTIVSIYGTQARTRGLDFELDIGELTCRRLVGDGLRVKQVLVNLLSNANKFTPKGGRVSLCARETADPSGKVWVEFAVSDTGIGMTEAFQRKLFAPFTQQDASIALTYGGSGLGMNITKNLTELMGGEIVVESVEHEGTTFSVRLPFAPAPEEDAAAVSHQKRDYDFKGRRLLLAEDNEMNMEIAEELLGQEGFEVVGAANGREAVDTFTASEEGAFDAILMDVQMPLLDGYAATRELRACKHPQARTIPVIAMTANAFAEDVKRALDAGMNDHIAKPIDINTLLDKLAAALNAKDQPVEAPATPKPQDARSEPATAEELSAFGGKGIPV